MKKLLLFALLVFPVVSFSQTVANQPPDLSLCNTTGFESIDLTIQTPIVLGDQDPENFTVTYFDFFGSPEDNTNPIEIPEDYSTGPGTRTIYARVDNELDGSYAITSFEYLEIGVLITLDDSIHCDGLHLGDLLMGSFYTAPGGPNGTGVELPNLAILTEPPGMIYVYIEHEGCIIEEAYEITAFFYPFTGPLDPLTGCDDDMDGIAVFDLTSIIFGITQGTYNNEVHFYESLEDAETMENEIQDPNSFTNSIPSTQTIYVRKSFGNDCESITTLQLIVESCTGSTFSGIVTYDQEDNDCSENTLPAHGMMLSCTTEENEYFTFTDLDGEYSFYNLPEDEVTIAVQSSLGLSYVISPSSYQATLSGNSGNNNFCVAAPDPVNNVSVYLLPFGSARPGFPAYYHLMMQNQGSYPTSGNISVTYNDDFLDFIEANSDVELSGNILSFNYELVPFQSQYILLEFLVMEPPTVELGDILNFTAALTGEDDVPEDNISILEQEVVNSYDPNDILVHEGEYITEEQAQDYLNYTIRFQNTGNADAVNIRIESLLDDNLDWNTFIPVASSHSYQVNRNGNNLKIYYNNIHLPDSTSNEPASHGYISYRIKPKTNIAVNDVMAAQANIFFDFNPAIITNTVTTTVQPTAGIKENGPDRFIMYPNPATDKVIISLKEGGTGNFKVIITDVLGKVIVQNDYNVPFAELNTSPFKSGIYFVTVKENGKSATQKLIIK